MIFTLNNNNNKKPFIKIHSRHSESNSENIFSALTALDDQISHSRNQPKPSVKLGTDCIHDRPRMIPTGCMTLYVVVGRGPHVGDRLCKLPASHSPNEIFLLRCNARHSQGLF